MPLRCAVESIRPGIGSRTLLEETPRIRPKPRSRMPSTAGVISAIGREHELPVGLLPLLAAERERVGARGGPPVFVTSTSSGPRSASTCSISAGAASRSAESCT